MHSENWKELGVTPANVPEQAFVFTIHGFSINHWAWRLKYKFHNFILIISPMEWTPVLVNQLIVEHCDYKLLCKLCQVCKQVRWYILSKFILSKQLTKEQIFTFPPRWTCRHCHLDHPTWVCPLTSTWISHEFKPREGFLDFGSGISCALQNGRLEKEKHQNEIEILQARFNAIERAHLAASQVERNLREQKEKALQSLEGAKRWYDHYCLNSKA